MYAITSATQHLHALWSLLPALQRLDFHAPVDQLSHATQCATRAWRSTCSEEWVLAALFHDLGRLLDPQRHGLASAVMLGPLVDNDTLWVVRMHDEFMLPYSPLDAPVDRFSRERYRDHILYGRARQFADEWDSRSFDPSHSGLPLSFFESLLFAYAARLDDRAARSG